tara:strand:- start:425 stop:721 length:297 start_codon:yes stop_codon:yes gene_type:complete
MSYLDLLNQEIHYYELTLYPAIKEFNGGTNTVIYYYGTSNRVIGKVVEPSNLKQNKHIDKRLFHKAFPLGITDEVFRLIEVPYTEYNEAETKGEQVLT